MSPDFDRFLLSCSHERIVTLKDGRLLPTLLRPEGHHAQLKASRDIHRSCEGPLGPARFRRLSFTYNCFGMVLANRQCWVEPAPDCDIDSLLTSAGYRRHVRVGDVVSGDVVLYRAQDGAYVHIGLVLSATRDPAHATMKFEVLSKWGQDGEYIHQANDVPLLLGTPREYWTDTHANEPA